MEFARGLREGVLSGDITVSIRLWTRPKVRIGGRYRVGGPVGAAIEVDSIEQIPFRLISAEDLSASGEASLDALRRRAAHAGPIDDDTIVYRVAFHLVD